MNRLISSSVAIATSFAALIGGFSAALAQGTSPPPNWSETKCVRYSEAWAEALKRFGTKGLGRDFLDNHNAFLASGCMTDADVCPRSKEELALANVMVVRAMNAGTASTFPPFACRK